MARTYSTLVVLVLVTYALIILPQECLAGSDYLGCLSPLVDTVPLLQPGTSYSQTKTSKPKRTKAFRK